MTTQNPTTQPPAAGRKPNTLRTVLLVIGSIVLAFILIGTAVRVAYSVNQEDTSGTFTVTDTFSAADVRTSAADVEVSYEDVDEPQIVFDQGGTNLRLDHRVSGDTLRITVDNPGWGWFNFGNWGFWNEHASLTLVLPVSMEEDPIELSVSSTAGDLDVVGQYANVAVESTAGNVRMAGGADMLEITTTAGDVRVSDYALSGAFRSDSTAGNGHFEFRSLPDSMDVQTTAGNLSVTMPEGRYRIEADTTAGSVTQNVSSTQGADRVYRFETTAGNIELNER